MPNVNKTSFAGGELKPSLHQRTDVSKYSVSCRVILNHIIHPSGGMSNRAGTRYINRAKYKDRETRLINFEYNTEQAYALEFGDQYMRVIKDGGQVLESNKTITAVTQASPAVVTSASHGYANGDWVFIQSIVGMTSLNGDFYLVANVATNTFELQNLDAVDIDSTGYDAYVSGGTVARVYEISTPYVHTDLRLLKFTQSANVMTFVHTEYEPTELTRTDHDAWTLSDISFVPQLDFPTGVGVSKTGGTGTTYKYKVTAVAQETLEESLSGTESTTGTITAATQANPVVITVSSHGYATGDEVYIGSVVGMTELNGKHYVIGAVTTNTFELRGIDGTGYTAYASAGTSQLTFVSIDGDLSGGSQTNTITFTAVTGAEKYNIYKEDNGIYGYIGSTETASFDDDNIDPDLSDTPPKSRDPFNGTDNKPGAVNLFEQRRTFAQTENKPDTVYTSQTSNYKNMNVSSPAKADDALTFTLAANQVNEIRHLLVLGDLIAMTSGGEWQIAGADGQPLQPNTINAKKQSGRGCSHVPPIIIGNTALFNQARGKKVRDLRYTLESDGYNGNDITILSSHLFKRTRYVDKRLKEWAYQQEPDSLVWCIHNDGSLTTLTYEREHQVWAWARHETLGNFKSVCSIPEDDVDRVYLIVERNINNQTVQYVEVMDSRDVDEDDIEFALFVDSGLTIEGNGKQVIPGFNWLEGVEVAILADGNDLPRQTVLDGTISLDKVYTTVTVGIPYNCDMQPMDIEFENKEVGTTKGKMKKINKIYMHVMNARAIKVAAKNPDDPENDPDESVRFEEFKQREWEDYDEPTRLKTGVIEIEVDSEWQFRAAPFFRHDSPTPITILGLTPQLEISE